MVSFSDDKYTYDFGLKFDGVFGEQRFNPTRALAPFSQASWRGATNLVKKAARSLARGDRDRCVALADRAARLPYDPHEQLMPGALAGQMLMFMALADASDESLLDDDTWLRAAIEVADASPVAAQREWRVAFEAFLQDYELEKREAKQLRSALDRLADGESVRNRGEIDPAELGPVIVELVEATVAYEQRLALSPAGA